MYAVYNYSGVFSSVIMHACRETPVFGMRPETIFVPGPGLLPNRLPRITTTWPHFYSIHKKLPSNNYSIKMVRNMRTGIIIYYCGHQFIIAFRCIFFAHSLDYVPDILLCRLLDVRCWHPQWSLHPMHHDWRLLRKIYRYHFWVCSARVVYI